MAGAELERILSGLREAIERVGANLVALERDEVRELLEATQLRGETAQRWQDARTKLSALFDDFTRLTSILDRAAELRSASPQPDVNIESQLMWLLQGQSVEVSVKPLPLSERGLFDASTKVARETPEQVLARMAEAFRSVNECISTIGHLWDELVPRLAALRQDLELVVLRCTELGPDWDDDLRTARARLDEISAGVLADPLSVVPAEVDDMSQRIVALRASVDRAYELSSEMATRLAAAYEALNQLDIARASAEKLRFEVATKLSSPSLPELPSGTTQLREQLALLSEDARGGNLRVTAQALEAWWTTQEHAAAQVQAIVTDANGALARRRELRGRLDAYSAKAARLGLSEDADLVRMHDAAQDALYTAPCDLDRADDLVQQYQRAIATPRAERKIPM